MKDKEKFRLKYLRAWFVIHFILDTTFAIPLFIAPEKFLALFGWSTIDPITSRIVAAALFGIGIESFLARNSNAEGFAGILNLKIIWSFVASLGIFLSLVQSHFANKRVGLTFLGIFVFFHILWIYYRKKIGNSNEAPLANASGIFSFPSSEQNPPKRKNTSHSSSRLRTRFSAKADKTVP